jgi:hypothetical protein
MFSNLFPSLFRSLFLDFSMVVSISSLGRSLSRSLRLAALVVASVGSVAILSPQVQAAGPMDSVNPAPKPAGKEDFSEYGFSPRTPRSVNENLRRPNRPAESSSAASESSAETQDDEAAAPVRSSRSRRSARHKKKPRLPVPEQATTELMIRPEDRSSGVVETAATVRSTVGEVKDPNRRPSFLLGLSVQQYEPMGRAQLQGAPSTDLGSPGTKPMIGLDFRWMPLTLEQAPQFDLGVFASVGYVSHPVKLRAPTGVMIEGTNLQTFKMQVGGAIDWHQQSDSRLGLRTNYGFGQFNTSQSSASSFASGSAAQLFASAGAFVDYMVLDHVSVSAGYEYRLPVGPQSPNLGIQASNLLVGVSGGFQ